MRIAYGFIFTAACLWALIGVLSKGLLNTGVAPLEIAFWRAALGGMLFCLHAGIKGELHLKRRSDLGFFLLFALVGIIHYASFAFAVNHGGVSLATVLLASAPVFVVPAARYFLGESLTPFKASLVLLTLWGVVLVTQDGGIGIVVSTSSIFWGLLAGMTHASYYIFDKWMLGRYSPVTICAFLMLFGALLLLPLVDFSSKSSQAWLLLLSLAVLSTYLAYLLYYTGLKIVEASKAVLVASIEPVIAGCLAAAFFGERFGVIGLLGAGLIVAAAVMVSLPEVGFKRVAARFALLGQLYQRP